MPNEKEKWIQETFEKLNSSSVFLSIFTNNYIENPNCLTELGMSIAMDKPIFLLIQRGVVLNQHIARLIDGYEFYESDDEESLKRATISLNNKIEKYFRTE